MHVWQKQTSGRVCFGTNEFSSICEIHLPILVFTFEIVPNTKIEFRMNSKWKESKRFQNLAKLVKFGNK